MTMLDRMRRHKRWLKWSLGLVCLAFVIFYIPDFLRGTGADAASGDTIARVEGREITAGEFRRTYQAQLQAYRAAYGSNMSEQLLKQLGIEQQILQQLVEERAALAEADRLGIQASDEEVRRRILAMPAFQENGQFIGEHRQLTREIGGHHRPARRRNPRRGAFDKELGNFVGFERRADRANDVDERLPALDAAAERALKHAQAHRQVEARRRQRDFARAAELGAAFARGSNRPVEGDRRPGTGASSRIGHTSGATCWRHQLSSSIHGKYTTRRR